MKDIADALAKVENQSDRVRLGFKLFDSEGVGLVNMLKGGSDELERRAEEARGIGYILSEEDARTAEDFNDTYLDAVLTVKGLKNTIGSELMPVVTKAMGDFTAFMSENRDEVELFSEKFAAFTDEAIPKVGEFVTGVGDIAVKLGKGVDRLAEFTGGWENFGKAIGALALGRLALRVGLLALSVGRLGASFVTLIGASGAGGIVAKVGPAFKAMSSSVGTHMAAASAAVKTHVGKMNADIRRLNVKAGLAMAGAALLTSRVADTPEGVAEQMRKNREDLDQGLRNAPVIGGAMRAYEGVRDWVHGKPQERAVGGAYRAGPVLVGERGPELRYENRAGFIAHHRQLERLADLSRRAGGGDRRDAGRATGDPSVSITMNNVIHAAGTSAQEVFDLLERKRREAQQGALFDHATSYGQYG